MEPYTNTNGASPNGLGSVLDHVAGRGISAGSEHTSREIAQQPELWLKTAEQIVAGSDRLASRLQDNKAIVLTGSGSSHYVGECIASCVQRGLSRTTAAVASGDLLLVGSELLPTQRPMQLVSFARSGDSPETLGLISSLLTSEPEIEHLVITCNHGGRVADEWGEGADPRVAVETLDERTCDESLVMTSSFTNMALAGMGLAYLDRPQIYLRRAKILAEIGKDLIGRWSRRIEPLARQRFSRMIALGSGGQFGAARESALKMLEMTDGRVVTVAESWLGLRHGPMCVLRDDSLLLLFVSSSAARRAYQMDLLREIRAKGLGGSVVAVGSDIPSEFLSDGDLAVDCPGFGELPDEWSAIAGVVVGQLLGFFRCLEEGLQPDQPAATGAISRVVPEFTIHRA